ncbi:MAG: alpha/beta hydrolase [Pseudomonadota bacterium]
MSALSEAQIQIADSKMKKNISLTDLEWAQKIRDQIPAGTVWTSSVDIPAFNDLHTIFSNHYDPEKRVLEKVHYVHKENMDSGRNAFEVVSHLWKHEQPQGSLIVMHGLFEHMHLYQHLIAHGLKHNLSAAGFDLPGHGLSSGRRASIHSFKEYNVLFETWLEKTPTSVKEALPKPWFFLGQSTGCALGIKYLLKNNNQSNNCEPTFKEVFFLAPLVRPLNYQKISWLYTLINRFVNQITRDYPQNSQDEKFNALLKSNDPLQCRYIDAAWVGAMIEYVKGLEIHLPTKNTSLNNSENAIKTPIHVFQGTHDLTVDGIYNLNILKQLFEANILELEGAGHHLANEVLDYRNQYLEVISKAIQKHVPLP